MIGRTAFLLCWAAVVSVLGQLSGAPGDLLALATFAVAGLLVAFALLHLSAGRITETASSVRAVALRQRARRTAYLRLRDPDASGRSRPRAPTFALRAA